MVLLAFGLKAVSRAPVEVILAIRLRATHPIVVKVPHTTIFPSGCICISLTALPAFGLKEVSRAPVEVTLAIRLRATHPTVVKAHHNKIYPSD